MRTLPATRRIRTTIVALVAVGATALPSAIAPAQAVAYSFTSGGKAATCYYRGAAYSEGAVEEMAGGKYRCSSDGTWVYIGTKDEPLPEEPAN